MLRPIVIALTMAATSSAARGGKKHGSARRQAAHDSGGFGAAEMFRFRQWRA